MGVANVSVPFAGYVVVTLEGDDAEGDDDLLVERALEKAGVMDITPSDDSCDVGEWEFLRAVARGNVCYAPLFEAEVEREQDD